MVPTLPGAPWLVAHRTMLGINKPYKITLNGTDYVLWQNSEGKISALENICPHMQAPLSEGWVCAERNTLACPFHALEFDGTGRFVNTDLAAEQTSLKRSSAKPLAKPLEIVVQGDFIWTYANQEPVLEIPTLHEKITAGSVLVGVAGDRTLKADFLSAVMVNYDFNHATATHRYPLNLQKIIVSDYTVDGPNSSLDQELIRGGNSWLEKLRDPALAFTPGRYVNRFEYRFPSTTCLSADLPSGQVISLFMLYPESETRTKTFVLVFAKTAYRWLVPLLRKATLKAFERVVDQDADMLAKLYKRDAPKIRLPNEEIMFRAEKLYHHWPDSVSTSQRLKKDIF